MFSKYTNYKMKYVPHISTHNKLLVYQQKCIGGRQFPMKLISLIISRASQPVNFSQSELMSGPCQPSPSVTPSCPSNQVY